MDYNFYMDKAIALAEAAFKINEVPIGCVIVLGDKIIGYGYNTRNIDKNALSHAEINAINMACKKIDDWRLEEATLFVTVEPCAMCAGAILQARIPNVVFGVNNKKFGSVGSVINLLDMDEFNHKCNIIVGVKEKECLKLMKDFFKKFR